jgi:hypothetical protein
MGANSQQGVALLVFLLAFTCLGIALFRDGSIPFLVLFLAALVASIALFLKARPLEYLTK